MRTFEYRLFVNKEQSRKLMACLAESRIIYNGMLETVKGQYEQDGTFPSKYDLEAAFKGQGEHVPATTVQMLADGHWYALIVCETEPYTEHTPVECSHPNIGMDVGLKSFLADSEECA